MRAELCYENAWQYSWFIVEGGLEFVDKTPLTFNYNWERPPIGYVTDIRREDDGAITGELHFFQEQYEEDVKILLKNNDAEVSIFANHITAQRVGDDLRVAYKATLRAVVIVLFPANRLIPEGVIPNG